MLDPLPQLVDYIKSLLYLVTLVSIGPAGDISVAIIKNVTCAMLY